MSMSILLPLHKISRDTIELEELEGETVAGLVKQGLLNVCDRSPLGETQCIIFEGQIVFHSSPPLRGGLMRPFLNTLCCNRCG